MAKSTKIEVNHRVNTVLQAPSLKVHRVHKFFSNLLRSNGGFLIANLKPTSQELRDKLDS